MNPKAYAWSHRGQLWLIVVLILAVLFAPMPGPARAVLAILLFAGLLVLASRPLVRRLGKKVIVAELLIVLGLGGAAGFAYWRDAPNRRLADQIRAIGGHPIPSADGLVLGKIESVYFDSEVGDDQVRRFTELNGIEGVRRLVLKNVPITDPTADRIGRLSHLRDLYIEGSRITQEAADRLVKALPECEIEVK